MIWNTQTSEATSCFCWAFPCESSSGQIRLQLSHDALIQRTGNRNSFCSKTHGNTVRALRSGPLILIKVMNVNNLSPLRWDRVAFISILSKMFREEKVAIIKPIQTSGIPLNVTLVTKSIDFFLNLIYFHLSKIDNQNSNYRVTWPKRPPLRVTAVSGSTLHTIME